MQSFPTPIHFAPQSKSRPHLHVAIIMDGNGRWATQRGLPRLAGHRAGVSAVRRIVDHAPGIGITALTLFAFSSENWRRPAVEVAGIFSLLTAYLNIERENLIRRGACLQVIGRRDRLPRLLLRAIERTESATAGGKGLLLRAAIDYSSRDAIAAAALAAPTHAVTQPPSSPDALRHAITDALTDGAGNVDLLIRTGGEKRLSDFLLWESAFAELTFTDRMWPDFDISDLEAALADFHQRQRRFGGLTPLAAQPAAVVIGGAR